MRIDLTQRSAIVTGAGSGIGRAVCIGLADCGTRVLAVDLSEATGSETAELCRAKGADVRFYQADVSDEAAVKDYVAAAVASFGGIDIFMNNAGWQGKIALLADYDAATFDKVMAINVRGVFLGLKHVLRRMTLKGAGAVVNTASLAAHIGSRTLGPYAASKHAVLGLTKTAALEVAHLGVRVNAVCPGPVATPMIDAIDTGQAGGNLDALRRQRTASIPDGRYATPEEVADLMIYLASDRARHITGQGIHINGGSHGI